MKKALFIPVKGEPKMVFPDKKKGFEYKELQVYIGETIQIVPLGKGQELICHDEGKLIGFPKNEIATTIWKKRYPIEEFPNNNDELVVGDVLVTGRNLEALLAEITSK